MTNVPDEYKPLTLVAAERKISPEVNKGSRKRSNFQGIMVKVRQTSDGR